MAGQAFSVLNNFSALTAQKDLLTTNLSLNKTLSRLSSGRRIVDASDDAAGLAIASSLKADSMAMQQATRNANDGIAIIQIADGALNRISDIMMRGVTLAEQAASDTVGTDEKITLGVEFDQILQEVGRVISVTNFKGERLISITSDIEKSVYVGDTNFTSFITISIGNSGSLPAHFDDLIRLQGDCKSGGLCCSGASDNAMVQRPMDIMEFINDSIDIINKVRGTLGAQQNRFQNAIGIIQVQDLNIQAAASAITDANMAEEIVNMTKNQILLQSGMSSLAQANMSGEMVLSLLR